MDINVIRFVEAHSTDYDDYKHYLALLSYFDSGLIKNGIVPYFAYNQGISDLPAYLSKMQLKFNNYDRQALDMFNRYYNSNRLSKKTCHRHFIKMLNFANLYSYKIIFLTFTFDNDAMDRLSAETKRRYVTRYLTAQPNMIDYFGNVDYGKENGRLHYHVIVLTSGDLDYSAWSSKYGAIKGKRVPLEKCNTQALTTYIVKLDNHAVKEKTNGQNKLSCRKPRYDDFLQFQTIDNRPPRKKLNLTNLSYIKGGYINRGNTLQPMQIVQSDEELPF